MNSNDIFRMMGYMAPMVSASLCFFLLLAYRLIQGKNTPVGNRLLYIMLAYYASLAVNYINLITYGFYPEIYVYINASYYIGLLLVQVLFYHLIYSLTGKGSGERFSIIHYGLPVAIVTVFTVWSLFVPFEVRLALVTSRGAVQPGYEAYSVFFTHRFELRGIYCLVYTLLGIRRLMIYRKVITGYSADEGRSSLHWLYWLIILSIAIMPIPIASFFFSKQKMVDSLLPLLPVFIIIMQQAILCYNLLAGNYVIIAVEDTDKKDQVKTLHKVSFEHFIRQEKPYLNPELKITDLAAALATNRSYLSNFINSEYGMNFSRYINQQRLQELERLNNDPAYNSFSKVGLTLQAGFSSYQGYRRFAKSEKALRRRPFIN